MQSRFVKIGLCVVLLVVLVWIVGVGVLALSLFSRATRLQAIATDPMHANMAAVASDVHGARQELTLLRSALSPVLWIGARFGGDLGAAEPLSDAAVESVIAADDSLSALAPQLADFTPASFSMSAMPRVLDTLVAARPALARSEKHLDNAVMSLARVKGPLSPRVARLVEQANTLVDLARQGIVAAQFAPEFLGHDRPRTYLVLVQNSDELRPTGGFIGSYGRVEISNGKVISQTFQDSYSVDDFSQEYPYPPQPIFDYMSIDQWVFRDSNWSPDFPTAARDALYIYGLSRPEQIDGVIGINLKAVQELIPGLAPLTVEGLSEPLTTENVAQVFEESWNPAPNPGQVQSGDWLTWYAKRKEFVGAVARAAMDQLLSGKANWPRLGKGLLDVLRERQLTIYSAGTEAAQLKRLRWDGAIRDDPGDYLMIVDANVGYGKVAPLINETIDYQVVLDTNGKGRAVTTINYAHQGKQSGIECLPYVIYDLNITYEKMIQRCYYDYLRLVVPKDSVLRDATAHPTPGKYLLSNKPADGKAETLLEEIGRTVFGQFFVVEYGKQLQTRFEYDLPVVVKDANGNRQYTLVIQKQSGTDALPAKVTVNLPPQSRLISVVPAPKSQSGVSLEFDLSLDTDQQVQVVYANP